MLQNNDKSKKIDTIRGYEILCILLSLMFFSLLITYINIGVEDYRFFRVTKYANIMFTILGIIFMFIAFYLQTLYYKLKFKNN